MTAAARSRLVSTPSKTDRTPCTSPASSLDTPWMCSVRLASVVALLCNGVAHPAIYLHLDIRRKRVPTDVRVFSVSPSYGAHIMLLHVCNWAPSGFCLDAYLLRNGPPHEANRKVLPDARKSCFTSPENPFWTRQSHDPRCSNPVCNRSHDLPNPSTRRSIRGLFLYQYRLTKAHKRSARLDLPSPGFFRSNSMDTGVL